jgi:hypothetical protein
LALKLPGLHFELNYISQIIDQNSQNLELSGSGLQGDQIGRIFAYWSSACGQLYENYRSGPNMWAAFSTEKNMY